MSPVLQACLCFIVLDLFRRWGLVNPTKQDVVRHLGVARSHVYETTPSVETALERISEPRQASSPDPGVQCADCRCPRCTRRAVESEIWQYRALHPGAWTEGGRTTYSPELHRFVLDLTRRVEVGVRITQAAFGEACDIPLSTLKEWWSNERRQGVLSFEPASASEPSSHIPDINNSSSASKPTSPTPPTSATAPEPVGSSSATPSSSETAPAEEPPPSGLPLEIVP